MSDNPDVSVSTDRFVSHPGGDQKRKLPKRFYKQVAVVARTGSYFIELDGRSIKTPAREMLSVPSLMLAEAIAAEWEAQETVIDPETMLLTKLANTTLDRVVPRRDEIIDEISVFGGSDLFCYRADHPDGLVSRQSKAWDPVLNWLEGQTGAKLEVTSGVIFRAQPEAALTKLRDYVADLSDFELSGLHQIVTISGSLALGLAVAARHVDPEMAHELAHIDEKWQVEQWGADEEAELRLLGRKEAVVAAARYLELLTSATS